MEQSDLLRVLVRAIDAIGLRYFITGSSATIFYGKPRFTNDIDVVVDLKDDRVDEFCRHFSPDNFYVSETAARDAVLRHSQFYIIHPESGLKVDVIVPELNPFNESRFARARRVRPAADIEASFASPEDAIIKKMEFYREGESDKHLRDIASVLKTSSGPIDAAYISKWPNAWDWRNCGRKFCNE